MLLMLIDDAKGIAQNREQVLVKGITGVLAWPSCWQGSKGARPLVGVTIVRRTRGLLLEMVCQILVVKRSFLETNEGHG